MSGVLLSLVLLIPLPSLETPQEVLDRAIAAAGGEQNLAKLAKSRYVSEATTYANGQAYQEMKLRRLLRLPDCMRLEVETGIGDKRQVATYVLRGNQGWTHVQGQYEEMRPRTVLAMLDDLHVVRVLYLLEAKDPRYQLRMLPPKRVEGAAAIGILVSGEGVPEVSLYFDRASGLLVKSEMRVRDAVLGHLIFQEIYLKDYQEVEGLKYPLGFAIPGPKYPMGITIYHNFSKHLEMKVKEVKFLETIRDSEFLRPG